MDRISGSVERITYYNPENGYSVIRLQPDQRRLPGIHRDGLATVVGNLPELTPGEHIRLQGQWVNHPKHGAQFQIETCEQVLPATVQGIRRYLGSGLIKGIGPRLAERIVARFGKDTLQVIEGTPERLADVQDIGPKRTRLIARAWQDQKQVKDIMLFLHSYGISTNLAVKIYKQYGDQSLQIVRLDPYRLAQDIYGVGFRTADRIAQSLGLPSDHPSRIEIGITYTLNEMSGEGHVYTPMEVLVGQAAELLEVGNELIPPAIDRLVLSNRVCLDHLPPEEAYSPDMISKPRQVAENTGGYTLQAVYLTPLYYGEMGVAERLNALNRTIPSNLSNIPPSFLRIDPNLSAEQQDAVRKALSHPVSVLTGGPGTGKTTAIKALITALEEGHKRYALAAPTGRAAKRLSEATGRPASTIHRLLGFSPAEGFKHNLENPLPVDMLVIDEASMLDLILTNTLLKALQPGTHLLLVGDVDQLPSVGAGDVLRDVIRSGVAPVTRLSVIFRQAAGSLIITNAHRINRGEIPVFKQEDTDFFLFAAETAEEAADWVTDVVSQRIPSKFRFRPKEDIQVLAPMYRGPAGVDTLNSRLQAVLNPPTPNKPEKSLFGQVFRLGDKVMQIQNNYDKEVFNGDIGVFTRIDLVDQSLEVNFEDRRVTYDWSEADQLVLAYAVSVHKAQGSEFPVVVLPLLTAHYVMLQRNLLYTAITRAKKLCVLVGNRRAISIAVRNNKVAQRYSALDWRLQK
jgi:exodeoxyribonuclease V alpha subunit